MLPINNLTIFFFAPFLPGQIPLKPGPSKTWNLALEPLDTNGVHGANSACVALRRCSWTVRPQWCCALIDARGCTHGDCTCYVKLLDDVNSVMCCLSILLATSSSMLWSRPRVAWWSNLWELELLNLAYMLATNMAWSSNGCPPQRLASCMIGPPNLHDLVYDD
jgi:hypothetical protein